MSREIFAFGDGQGSVLCLERYEKNLGPFIYYRYSNTFQVHRLTMGRFALVWRIGPYRWSMQNPPPQS